MRTNSQLAKRFRMVVRGTNIMTPELLGFYEQGWYIAELTKGVGFSGQEIYGVTVVLDQRIPKRCLDLDKCFDSLEEAKEYIKGLK